MTIRVTPDLKPGDLFTKDGRDVWELEWYYTGPSFQLRNLRTGQTENFGQGGEMARRYEPLPANDPHVIMRAAFDRMDWHTQEAGRLLRMAYEGRVFGGDPDLRERSVEEIEKAREILARARIEITKTGPTYPKEDL